MWRDRISAGAWRLSGIGMVTSAGLVLAGGLLAGVDRSLSDSIVLAGFLLLVPCVALGWVGLRAASAPLPATASPAHHTTHQLDEHTTRTEEPVR